MTAAYDNLPTNDPRRMRTARTEVAVLCALNGPTKVAGITQSTGIPQTTVRTVLHNMMCAGVVEKIGYCNYSLTEV